MRSLAVDSKGNLSIVNISMPGYNDCQALVKILSSGVCNGTDSKLISNSFKNMDNYPMLLGHEAVGEVIEVGKKVTSFKIGDIVLLPFLYDEIDGYFPGWGGFSEYAVVGDWKAYEENGMGEGTSEFSEGFYAQKIIKMTEKINPINAAMIITFREVLSAMKRFGFKENSSVVIFGAGPVGQCFIQFSKLLGLKDVFSIDINDEKVAIGKKRGADFAFNSRKTNIKEKIKSLYPEGVDFVIDAVGVIDIINEGMELIKDHGKICVYGIAPNTKGEINWSKAPYNWSLDFLQMPRKKEEAGVHNQIIAWIESGALNPDDYISHVINFDDIIEAFQLIKSKPEKVDKIVIKY